MMKIRTLIFMILLIDAVSAITINNINVAVDETGYASVKETIVVPIGTDFFETWIPENVENLALVSPRGPLEFNKTTVDGRIYLGVGVPVTTKNKDVTLSYSSRFLTTKSKGVWTLKFFVPSSPRRTIVKITLPFNSTILDWEPKIPFSPNQDGLYVFPEIEEFNFTLTYIFGGVPLKKDYRPLLGLTLVVLVALTFIFLRKKRTETKEEPKPSGEGKSVKESVIKMLEENERKIVEILQEAEEEITQATIYNETQIPKASLSDIMRRLERRNIIERKREGRRNWVKLKKWVFE